MLLKLMHWTWMGGYWIYLWPAFFLAFLLMGGFAGHAFFHYRQQIKLLQRNIKKQSRTA